MGTSIHKEPVLPKGRPSTHPLVSVGCPVMKLSNPYLARGRGTALCPTDPHPCSVPSWGCRKGDRNRALYLLPKGSKALHTALLAYVIRYHRALL